METVTLTEQSTLSQTIGTYLIQRLNEHGVHHVFGVPGDYILGFNKLLEESSIQFINTCDEQGAGFAAGVLAGWIQGMIVGAAVAGGLVGALVGLGIPKEQALKYETEIKAGKFMVIVLKFKTKVPTYGIFTPFD